ncbi:hypothetical protein NEOLEDRAFT_1152057 [Neolentinus lepideus HHB14362 ss-1]|uniref:Protein PNS1 n=1 Tax=Neolentinus lepideus HHB14362 ss-1 TaxID=1314782 RepID=A0A165N943_9AGAM|nr:hypothetical protein NEOLEDRAFT_1152057 [Neolentinus lepideus HHB14362 ss-1]
MNASFAAYASQFLTRQQQQTQASSLTSSQPLFFSFTTDNGSRGGNDDTDLDDLDDPHLRASEVSREASTSSRRVEDYDDDDPYLRLDEEDGGGPESHSIPLLQSHHEPSHGWLAHHASPLRPESPLSTSSSEESRSPPIRNARSQPPPPPPRTAITLSLTESLLPRDGSTRATDAFSLPDPRHMHRGRRKYNDSIWTALWLGSVGVCIFFSILLLFLTSRPKNDHHLTLPYPTLLHTVPLLTIITFFSALVSYMHIFLLRIFVAPVIFATSVFIPATLFISALWAFIGSFMWDTDIEPTWGETVGLRLFSLVPLVLSLLTARRLGHLPREIHTTSSLLTLVTRLLVANPFLLALSPAILLATLLASIPFVTLIFRLLLYGYFSQNAKQGGWEYHLKAWAGWAIIGSIGVWMWCWAVARGVLRVTTAGVIGAWYFADQTAPLPLPMDTHIIHAALFRSTQPSLGTVCLASLILTITRLLLFLASALRALPTILPLPIQFRPVLVSAMWLAGYLEGKASSLSTYALVYTGLTGEAFWRSAERAGEVTRVGGERDPRQPGRYRRRFTSEPPLTLLTVAPLTLTFPFALTTYLFVAHTLNAPDSALGAALLGGGVTALVGVFCVGLVRDTADAVYMCYCIDKSAGQKRRQEVFDTFEYDVQVPTRPTAPAPRHPQASLHQPMLSEGLRLTREPLSSMHQHEDESSSSDPDPEPFFPEPQPQPYDARVASPPPPSYSPHESKREGDLETGLRESRVSGEGEGEESQLFPGSDFF